MSEVELSQTLSEAFNTDVEEGSSFDLVPTGNYVAVITDAMVGNLKSGNGQSIRMTGKSKAVSMTAAKCGIRSSCPTDPPKR